MNYIPTIDTFKKPSQKEMRELCLDLKWALINSLRRDTEKLNEKYLVIGEHNYTRGELADHIEDNTGIGLSVMYNVINLSLDLIKRKNG